MGKSGCGRLERTTNFYTQLGFKSNGAFKELTSCFVGDDDFIIHFFLKDILKANTKGEIADLKYGNEEVFTPSADSKEADEKKSNKQINSVRVAVEHVIRCVKIFRIMGERYRNRRKRFSLRLKLISAIYNFEL